VRRAGAALLALTAAVAGGVRAAAEPEPEYELRLPELVTGVPDRAGTVSLTITPRPGFRVDADGPLRIEVSVEPAAGLDLPRRRYARRDAADAQAEAPRFDLRYLPRAPGAYRLHLDLAFWMCGRHTCSPARARRAVAVQVEAPPPAP
jgi:hypothetical protein